MKKLSTDKARQTLSRKDKDPSFNTHFALRTPRNYGITGNISTLHIGVLSIASLCTEGFRYRDIQNLPNTNDIIILRSLKALVERGELKQVGHTYYLTNTGLKTLEGFRKWSKFI